MLFRSMVEIYPSDHYMQDFNGARAGRSTKKTSLIRTRRTASGEDESGAKCASLSLENDLESMTKDWDKTELAAGRRLVRFTRIQDGAKLLVSCATVRQEDYAEGDAVISCIYRKETDSCYVTSVDIILLLERLVGHEFDIEEKNRIRRNLEGFRPKTVSKNRPDSSEFFLQIMNFPAPKPRNIEKDLKVFDWAVLPQALEKIISRYVRFSRLRDCCVALTPLLLRRSPFRRPRRACTPPSTSCPRPWPPPRPYRPSLQPRAHTAPRRTRPAQVGASRPPSSPTARRTAGAPTSGRSRTCPTTPSLRSSPATAVVAPLTIQPSTTLSRTRGRRPLRPWSRRRLAPTRRLASSRMSRRKRTCPIRRTRRPTCSSRHTACPMTSRASTALSLPSTR